MFAASNPSYESKRETELDNIAILKELKLFFIGNKHQGSESQDCLRYNSVLEAHNAILVYDEEESVHKFWVNDEPLEPQGAIGTLTAIIESLEALHARDKGGVLNIASSSTANPGNTEVKTHAELNATNHIPTVNALALSDTKEREKSSFAIFSQKAQVVTGYYESNDILFLRDAFLSKEGLKLDADNSIIKDGCRTYLVPPFCGMDGLEALNGLKETICIALLNTEKIKQILCPYRMKWVQHWVTICILVTNQNNVHFKLHDSANLYSSEEIEIALQDFFQQQKEFSDFIAQNNRIPKLTKIDIQARLKTIFFDEQGVKKINFENQGRSNIYPIQARTGNVYCGGYATRLIVSLTSAPKQDVTKEAVWNCGSKEDKDLREEDAQIITEYNSSKISVFGRTGNGSGYKNTSVHFEKDAEQKRKTREAFSQIKSTLNTLDEKILSSMHQIISKSTLDLDGGGNIKNILIDIYKKNREKLSANNPLSYFFDGQPPEIDQNSKLDSGLLFVELFKEFKGILTKKLRIKPNVQLMAGRDVIVIDKAEANVMSFQSDNIVIHQFYGNKPVLNEAALSPKQCLIELQQKLVEHCQDEHWYLKRLFDDIKTPIENSYISLSIITADEQQRKQKQLEEIDNAKSDRIARTIDERTPSHEDLFVHKESIDLSDLFKMELSEYESRKRLIVFGRAGIGKSILCQYLTIRWYQEVLGNSAKPVMFNPSQKIKGKAEKVLLPWLHNFKLVFWIRLREIPALLQASKKNSPLESIINHCCYSGKAEQDMLKTAIKAYQQESLFILDGYDEIEEILDKDSPIHQPALLAVWNTLKEQTNVILTSRPRNLNLWPRDKTVKRLEVMGFSNEQVEGYVQNFMAESSNKGLSASALLSYLKSRASIWGIAHIPINLEMLCWLYCERKIRNKANSLSMLYEKIIEGVVLEMPKKHKALNGWLEAPILGREGIQRYALKEIGLQFLAHLAYQAILKNELLLSSKTIELSAKAVFDAHKISYDKCLTEKLLETSRQLGFLFSTGQGGKSTADQSHYFIHLSFQEHFGARYVAFRLTSKLEEKGCHESTLIKQIQEKKHHPRYQLMWWLAAGLLAFQGTEAGDYEALKKFAHPVFLGFLSQDYMMSEADFKLAVHALDECLGANQKILFKMLNDSEHENLKKKMSTYFSHLRKESLETLERCSNFFSMYPFIDVLLITLAQGRNVNTSERRQIWAALLKIPAYANQAAAGLIVLAEDKSVKAYERMQAWEALLKIPERANQAAAGLIALAEDKSVKAYERMQAWKILLKIPAHANQAAAAGLIVLAQDQSVDAYERMQAWEALLKIPERANQAAAGLIALAEDKSISAWTRMQACKILLKIPAYANQAAAGLIALAEDKSIGAWTRMQACKILLKIPAYANQAVAGLIALAEDKSVKAYERMQAWEILLKMPEHANQTVAALIVWAEDKSVEVYERMQACETLLKIPDHAKRTAETLIGLTQDKSVKAYERMQAWEALLKIPEYANQAAAIALAQDKSVEAYERMQAYETLLKIPEHANQAATRLIALAQDQSVKAYKRVQAWETLLEISAYANQAAAGLIALAQDQSVDAYERMQACEILLKIPEHAKQTVETLIALAEDKSIGAWTRMQACEILLKIPEHAKQTAETLIALAEDKSIDADERMQACKILLKIPDHANQAATRLIVLARDKSVKAYKRVQAWEILLKIPAHVNQATAGLITLTQGQSVDAWERRQTWEAFLKIPVYANQAAAELIALAQDKSINPWTKRQTWEALLKIPQHTNQAAVELIALAQDKSVEAWIRMEIWKTLLKISEHANQAVTGLITLAQNKSVDASQRGQVWETLLKMPEHANQTAAVLIVWAEDKSVEALERMQAWEALLKIPEHVNQAEAGLIALAEDKSVEALERMQAWEALLKIPEHANQAEAELIGLAEDKSVEAWIRMEIWKTLLKIPEHANQAATGLIALAQDKSVETSQRRQVWETLLEISAYANQAVAGLVALAQDKSVKASKRMRAWAILLKIPEHVNQAVEALITLVQDKSVDAYERMQAWATLLKMPEHARKIAETLIAIAQDKSVDAWTRREAWEILLKIPEHAKQMAETLIALAQDKIVDARERVKAWETLLKMPKHANQAAKGLTTFAQDKSVDVYYRRQAWKTLFKIPEHAEQARKGLEELQIQNNVKSGKKNEIPQLDSNPSVVIHLDSGNSLEQKVSPMVTQFNQSIAKPVPKEYNNSRENTKQTKANCTVS